ncbi:DUF58 domain-containing protein [Parafrigoribacterium soli]|uniref:DUF58 domain-containing protein n=1 Tax=Parafrigoribacterium soli TaxID=3144663 RepID=UPI0032EB1B3E
MAVVGVVLLLLGYAFARTEMLFIGWLAVALPATALLFVRLRPLRMAVARSFSSPMLVAGHAASGTIELRNQSPYAAPGARWAEALAWRPFTTPFERLPAIPGRTPWRSEPTVLHHSFTPPRRGVFDIGPLVIELSDPFGLARGEVAVGETQRVIVIPDVEVLRSSGLSVTADDGAVHAHRFRSLGGDDDAMTRNYRSGDALRRVHWRASAHRGELMVREEEQRSHAEACIVLDTVRRGYGDRKFAPEPHETQSDRFEWALRMTATLALHLEQRGFLVQLLETGPRQLESPERVDAFLESVAAAELSPNAAESVMGAAPPRPHVSLGVVFAIVADAEPATIELLAAQRRRFELAIALIVTPRFDEIAEQLAIAGWNPVDAEIAESVGELWETIMPLLESRNVRH